MLHTYDPDNPLDALFVGAQVYCVWRELNKMQAEGKLLAFIYGDQLGRKELSWIVEFKDSDRFLTRYWVDQKHLLDNWDIKFFVGIEMKYIGIAENKLQFPSSRVSYMGQVKVFKRRVAVYGI